MTWNEVKYEGYDFCMQSGNWTVKRKGEQVGLYYYDYRIQWCDDVKKGMFEAWTLELRKKRRNG